MIRVVPGSGGQKGTGSRIPDLGSATLMATKGHERGFLSHTVHSHSTNTSEGEQLVYFNIFKGGRHLGDGTECLLNS
jgi:hypothetical protein